MGVNVVVHLGSSREGVKVVAGERGEFGGPVGGARDATVRGSTRAIATVRAPIVAGCDFRA